MPLNPNTEGALRAPAALTGVFVVGLLLGAGGGVLLARAPAAAPGHYRFFCDVLGHEPTMNGHLLVGALR